MLRILVPAVGPDSDEAQLRRWIADLEFLLRQHADLAEAVREALHSTVSA